MSWGRMHKGRDDYLKQIVRFALGRRRCEAVLYGTLRIGRSIARGMLVDVMLVKSDALQRILCSRRTLFRLSLQLPALQFIQSKSLLWKKGQTSKVVESAVDDLRGIYVAVGLSSRSNVLQG